MPVADQHQPSDEDLIATSDLVAAVADMMVSNKLQHLKYFLYCTLPRYRPAKSIQPWSECDCIHTAFRP
jgi:hypothetical protein